MADKDQASPETIAPEEGEATFSEAFKERATNPFGDVEEGKAEDETSASTDQSAEEADKVEASPQGDATDTSGEQKFDPWNGLTPEQKSYFERVEKSDRSNRGRVGALTRKVNDLLKGRETSPPQKQGEGDQTDEQALESLDDRLKKVAEDYGDVTGPVVEAINALREEVGAIKTKGEIDTDADELAKAYDRLAQAHPDYANYGNENEAMIRWLEKQPDDIKAKAASFDPDDAIDLISRFKADSGQSPGAAGGAGGGGDGGTATGDKRRRQLEGSRDARTRGAPAASGVPNDFRSAFKARSQQIERERQAR